VTNDVTTEPNHHCSYHPARISENCHGNIEVQFDRNQVGLHLTNVCIIISCSSPRISISSSIIISSLGVGDVVVIKGLVDARQ